MTKYVSFYFDPNEETNTKSTTVYENDLPDTGLLDQYGRKLYRDEKIKLGFDLTKRAGVA